jgi:ribonuclease BN (tRNA processing enzyme)
MGDETEVFPKGSVMRLAILGSGTCLGPLPGTKARMPPLFALDVAPRGEKHPQWLLFDCSEGARWRLPEAGIDPARVQHIAISHPHPDHAALPQFIQGRACEALFRPPGDPQSLALKLYLPTESAESIESLWRWHQPEDQGRATSRYPLTVVSTSDGFEQEIFDGVLLQAFRVYHSFGKSPALAFRVEAHGEVFAYSGDTGLCDGIVRAAQNATLFVCEASSRVGEDCAREYGHLNPRQAASIALEGNVQQLVLTHYAGLDSDDVMLSDARSSGYKGSLSLARDGAWIQGSTAR